MDTMQAYARSQLAQQKGDKHKVFDWDKAALLIKERQPNEASAGLHSDWEYTGGPIYSSKEGPEKNSCTYLASNWATPELDLDGTIIDCFVYDDDEHNPNKWDQYTFWPESALAILNAGDNGNETNS